MARAPRGRRQVAETVHVARQPIHDARGGLYGYELLFRDTATATRAGKTDDGATTATILAAFSEFGAESLLGGRPGFINVTRAFLTGALPLPFTPGNAVLEVLETVSVDDEVVVGALRLAGQGYKLALDDFAWTPRTARLLEVAEIVKVDVLAMPWEQVLETAGHCRDARVALLAEKIEDEEMLRRCIDAGFTLFQGYHLGLPETFSVGTLSPVQAVTLEILARLGRPGASAADVEEQVRRDPALVYRLLQIANSAATGTSHRVSSVRDALVLVGPPRLRAWLVLLATGRDDGERGTETLTRARMCEQLARRAGRGRPEVAFTAGLLHGVAEALALDPAELRRRMPSLSPELAAALTGGPGPLRDVLDAVLAYEHQDLAALAAAPLPLGDIAEEYLAALAWTTETTRVLAV